MRHGRTNFASGAAAAIVAVPLCAAQDAAGSAWDEMRRVEPGRSDLGRLAVESRIEPVEMRLTEGFETLWRGVGIDGQTWFARRDGGVTAVFDRSDYAQTDFGQMPLIPAGTTFVIGEPDSILASRLGIGPVGPSRGQAGVYVRDASGGLRISTRAEQIDRPTEASRARPVDASDKRGVFGLLRMAASREKNDR